MFMLKEQVKKILTENPDMRDDDWALSMEYYLNYFSPASSWDFIRSNLQVQIARYRADLQKEFPELRWEKYHERKKYSKVKEKEFRHQETPENLSKIHPLWD